MTAGYEIEFESGGVKAGVVSDDMMMPDVVRPVQTHSCNVGVIDSDGVIPALNDTDALVCLAKGIRVGVRTADCVPVLVYAPDIKAIAAIHAGWKGTIGGIVGKTMKRLAGLGADLSKAEAAFGPSICGFCYEVSPELAGQFAESGYRDCIVAERHVDLEAVNRKQLIAAGIPDSRIHGKLHCTYTTGWLPSWRRSPTTLRLLTWIEMGPKTTENFRSSGGCGCGESAQSGPAGARQAH